MNNKKSRVVKPSAELVEYANEKRACVCRFYTSDNDRNLRWRDEPCHFGWFGMTYTYGGEVRRKRIVGLVVDSTGTNLFFDINKVRRGVEEDLILERTSSGPFVVRCWLDRDKVPSSDDAATPENSCNGVA